MQRLARLCEEAIHMTGKKSSMHLMSWAALALVAASAGTGAVAQPLRLEEQRAEGIHRTCVYRNVREVRTLQVGRGEPCPARYRERREEAQTIPTFATLKERRYQRGQTVCVYTYLGREHLRPLPSGSHCTYTPSGSF